MFREMRISSLISAKFPCPPGYLEEEIDKDAINTLCFSVVIENITGKLVNEA